MLLNLIKEAYPAQDKGFYQLVFELSVLYSIKIIEAFSFQKRLTHLLSSKKIKGPSAKVFRLTLIDQSYVCLNIKLFVLNVVHRDLLESHPRDELLRKRKLKEAIGKYKIKKNDFLYLVPVLRDYHKLIKQKTPDLILTLDQVKDGFAKAYPSVNKYIQSITFRKLTFIVNSNNLTHSDFQCELMTKIVKSYYLLVPTLEPDAFIVNYLKRAAHNHAMNLIKSYKYQKRDRLTSTKDKNGEYQFTLLCVSESQEKAVEEDSMSQLDAAQETTNLIDRLDDKHTANAMRQAYTASNSQLVLRLILAQKDEGFTEYLKNSKLIKREETNVSFYKKAPIEAYKLQISKYTGLSVSRIDKFIRSVYEKHYGVKLEQKKSAIS